MEAKETIKKIAVVSIFVFLITWTVPAAAAKELEIQGKQLVSRKPPFTLALPSQLQLMYSSAMENQRENSITRVYVFVKEKNKQVEEMLIVQIADKTNPQATAITAPPLRPYTDKRLYQKDRIRKGGLVVDRLVQLMAWNPDAPSLQPIVEKGITIPSHWALQGQLLFIYQGEHAIFIKYSKDVNSFGSKVSEEKKDWEKELISGNEKKTCETFQKMFSAVIDSINLKNP